MPPSAPASAPATAPPGASGRLRVAVRQLRPHQWVKNVLVFLPLLLAHRVGEPALLAQAALAFVAVSLCASGGYVANDLLDREHDRLHPTKRLRPFASGALPPTAGYVLAPALVLAGAAVALLSLPSDFLGALALYVVTTLAYSLRLKREPALDVVILAGLYTLRVFAGAAATGIPVSEWLLGFSLFFFLNLALLKRYAELRLLEADVVARGNGRGYTVEDVSMLRGLGPAAGFLAVLVLALYLTSPEVAELYRRPGLLWLVAPLLLYWIMRMWLHAHRRDMPDEPVLFTVKDPASWVVGALTAAVVAAAAVLP